ncbi:S8 family peptidase [Paenibacillus sp. CAU 1782]
MRKSKWTAAFVILAAAALLIPATPFFLKDGDSPPKTVPFSANKEQRLKLAALQNDMDATATLMLLECAKDFRNIMAADGDSPKKAEGEIKALMKEHPHLSHIRWIGAGKDVQWGKLPPSAKDDAQIYSAEAAKKIAKGANYESKPFESSDGSRYVVLGVPDQTGSGHGIVGIMKQDIVKQVEMHQKRNLRLIPYPAEGNYRIESVKPNSTVDTTVRTGEDNGNASHYHVKDAVVHFAAQPTPEQLSKIKADVGAAVIQQLGDTYVFRSDKVEADNLIQYFQNNWKIEYTEPHYLYLTNDERAAKIVPNDALYSQYQWNLPSIAVEQGWTLSRGDEGVVIAVLDTGVQSSHPDLKGRLLDGTNIVNTGKTPDDDVGHGTHVAGIIGAAVNNGEGVAGVSWFNKIMPIKVLDSSGAGSTYSVAQGIIWAVDHGAKVINMSLGNYAKADFLHDAIKYAYERDVVLIAASGNDNTDRPGYPAAYPEVFAVAATASNDQKASFSNYGDYIDVAAPGDSIASTYPGSQYAALSGTSMASPHVAALAGLIRSINPELSNEEVMEIMRVSARDLGKAGKDNYFGHGEIDVDKALQAAANYGGALQTFPQQVKRKLERVGS